jgi:heme/copper-type cytochrome/quinol oxidase subunit 4
MDLESRPDALTYYHLSRASLSLESVLERPSLEAIQALVAIAHFMFFSDVDEPRWMIMGIVVKMVYSASLIFPFYDRLHFDS